MTLMYSIFILCYLGIALGICICCIEMYKQEDETPLSGNYTLDFVIIALSCLLWPMVFVAACFISEDGGN